MLLTEVLAVPVDVQHLLVKLLVLFFLLWLLLQIFLNLAYLKPDLLQLHHQSEEVLNAQFFLVGQVALENLLEDTFIYVLRLDLVSNVKLVENLLGLQLYLLVDLEESLQLLQLLVL